jgi:hypothetical protein
MALRRVVEQLVPSEESLSSPSLLLSSPVSANPWTAAAAATTATTTTTSTSTPLPRLSSAAVYGPITQSSFLFHMGVEVRRRLA